MVPPMSGVAVELTEFMYLCQEELGLKYFQRHSLGNFGELSLSLDILLVLKRAI